MTRAILLLLISVATVFAQEIKWDNLCAVAHSKALSIIDNNGVKARGFCLNQSNRSILLKVDGGLGTVARDDIDSIRIDKVPRSHCLASVRHRDTWVGNCVPAKPLLGAPDLWGWSSGGRSAILAGGAPVCSVYDLVNRLTGSHKITII